MGEGFPLWSLAPMAWEGREPLQDWIYLSVSAFSAFTPSPFLLYLEICNSDWGESFAQIVLVKLAFLRQNKSVNRLTGGPREARECLPPWGARPYLMATSDTVSRWFYFPKIINIPKKISVCFYPVWTQFDIGFLRNKKRATPFNWHWALDQYVSPKNNIKSCQKYM